MAAPPIVAGFKAALAEAALAAGAVRKGVVASATSSPAPAVLLPLSKSCRLKSLLEIEQELGAAVMPRYTELVNFHVAAVFVASVEREITW